MARPGYAGVGGVPRGRARVRAQVASGTRRNNAAAGATVKTPALNLSRGLGKHVSNAAEHDEHDDDSPCDLEGAASTRSSGAGCREGLGRGHRPSWPSARGAMLVSRCLSHHKSLADPSLIILLLRARSLRVRKYGRGRRFAQQIWQVAQLQCLGLGFNARAFPRLSLLAADGIGRRPSCSRGEGRPPAAPS
jgi:hypothetical protein